MKNLSTIGRILFALPFGIIGLNHFILKDYFAGLLTSFTPGGGYTILLVGAALILASVSIILNRYVLVASISLAALMLIFILTIHIPGLLNTENYMIPLFGLLKDTGLMGGALIVAGCEYQKKN